MAAFKAAVPPEMRLQLLGHQTLLLSHHEAKTGLLAHKELVMLRIVMLLAGIFAVLIRVTGSSANCWPWLCC